MDEEARGICVSSLKIQIVCVCRWVTSGGKWPTLDKSWGEWPSSWKPSCRQRHNRQESAKRATPQHTSHTWTLRPLLCLTLHRAPLRLPPFGRTCPCLCPLPSLSLSNMVRHATQTSSHIDHRTSSLGTLLSSARLPLRLATHLHFHCSLSSQSIICLPHPLAHRIFPITKTGSLSPSGQENTIHHRRAMEMRALIRALGALCKLDLEAPTTTQIRVCSSPPSELSWTLQDLIQDIFRGCVLELKFRLIVGGRLQGFNFDSFLFERCLKIVLHEHK